MIIVKKFPSIICLMLVVSLSSGLIFSKSAHAVDKRVIMMGKAAGYGAAAGFLVGGGALIMGLGTTSNLYRGASLGLYAGILLGAFILVTQNMDREKAQPENPWRPQRPMSPDDWKDKDYEQDFGTEGMNQPSAKIKLVLLGMGELNGAIPTQIHQTEKVSVWNPVVSLNF